MASPEQLGIDRSLGTVVPRDGVALGGWVVMAEWVEPDGQKFLTRLVSGGTSPWQVRADARCSNSSRGCSDARASGP